MTNCERFKAVMNFEPFDRLPVIEWAPWWNKTLERWINEGLSREQDNVEIIEHFGLDVYIQVRLIALGSSGLPPAGSGGKFCSDMDSYEKIQSALFPIDIDKSYLQSLSKCQECGEALIWYGIDGFFWFPRKLFGIEQHLYAFFDNSELMHRMNSDLSDWMLRCIDEIFSVCKPTFVTFLEDLSYNHGPMISKKCFDEFLLPYYRKIIPLLKEKGIFCMIDSDGDVTDMVPWFEQAGLDGILPLERQAGVDIAKIRQSHPKMRFIGGFDKRAMYQGEEAMRAEFERLLPVAAQGGYLISCDHQTPPEVSIENYKLYIKLFKEYAEKV